ncbi:hypothetical protein, partial [Reyranella sp.]|uniref:hypothetical protein n=1 Tax=Reyranella sp. TaxID=1929291 RepID=UPI003F6EE931
DLLHRRGVRGGRVLLVYGLLFLAIHVPIALNVTAIPKLLWFTYVMFGGTSVVCYALITRAFAPGLAGRVNTTLNLICMLIAFVVQAAIGPALAWMETTQGLARAEAYQVVTVALLVIQAVAWAWFAMSREARDLP